MSIASAATLAVPSTLLLQITQLPHAPGKVLAYIAHRLLTFGKTRDAISYSQFLNGVGDLDSGCGLKDRTTLAQAIRFLEDEGLIEVSRRRLPSGRNATNEYELAAAHAPPEPTPDEEGIVGQPDRQCSVVVDRFIVQDLRSHGVKPNTARRLAQDYDAGHIREKIAMLEQKSHVANPAGWLVQAIREDWQPVHMPASRPSSRPLLKLPLYREYRTRSEPDPGPDAPEHVVQWWQTAHHELQYQMPRETFEAWLRNARLLSGRDEGEVVSMVIGVQSQQAREWLECRLKKVIERALGSIVRKPIEVAFVVGQDIVSQFESRNGGL